MCPPQGGAFPPAEEYVEEPKAIRREARECHITHATVGLAIATQSQPTLRNQSTGSPQERTGIGTDRWLASGRPNRGNGGMRRITELLLSAGSNIFAK
jgi:hypothetical protein